MKRPSLKRPRTAKPRPMMNSYPLFKHMADTYGLTLLESELQEIFDKVDECRKKPKAS